MIILKAGQNFINVYSFQFDGSKCTMSPTKLIIKGRQLERAKIMRKLENNHIFFKANDHQINYISDMNLELSNPKGELDRMPDTIIDFAPFKIKNKAYNLEVTFQGLTRLTEIDLTNNTSEIIAEIVVQLHPNENCNAIAVNPQTQFAVVSTFSKCRYLSRIVLIDMNTTMTLIQEIDCVNFINSPISHKVGSFFRSLCFKNYYGQNPLLIAFQYEGNKMAFSYYVQNAKILEFQDPVKIASGTVIDSDQFADAVYILDDVGNMSRLRIQN